MPGRFEVVAREPLTIVDGAHNPAGWPRSSRRCPAAAAGSLVAVVSILDDKDAAGMLRALLPACARACSPPTPTRGRFRPPTLESLARQLGFAAGRGRGRPGRALEPARGWRARTARCWPPARSTWSRSCSPRRARARR